MKFSTNRYLENGYYILMHPLLFDHIILAGYDGVGACTGGAHGHVIELQPVAVAKGKYIITGKLGWMLLAWRSNIKPLSK
jgi:hypothetical protein